MGAPTGCPAEGLARAPGPAAAASAVTHAAAPSADSEPLSQAEKDYVRGVLHAEPNESWLTWPKADVARFVGYVRARKEEPEPGISGLRFVCLHIAKPCLV
jgi:hypothetical protein